ncbi:MAG: hypothetical protein D4S01_09760 [Dehalococcoidia bacterium]|nr:MAG: hypothetical protein D4S01_09760 [Dehalococcoidia bacterium]
MKSVVGLKMKGPLLSGCKYEKTKKSPLIDEKTRRINSVRTFKEINVFTELTIILLEIIVTSI